MNPSKETSSTTAKVVLLLSFICLALLSINGLLTPGIAQSNERVLEDTLPKHLPIKVKIRKEKEKAFKDLKNENWVRDFELEVTNTGDKPIYFLKFLLILPEVRDETGYNRGFGLHYGRAELGNEGGKPGPDDVPIKPGETYTFKIIKGEVLGWDSSVKRNNWPQPKHVVLKFQVLSFGDGTGFWATEGIPFTDPPKGKAGVRSVEQEARKTVSKAFELQHAPPRCWTGTNLTGNLPASFLPVFFLAPDLLKSAPFEPSIQPQECCPGNGCARITRRFETSCLDCGPVARFEVVSCSGSAGTCLSPNPVTKDCRVEATGLEYKCLDYSFDACGGTMPPMTPSPPPGYSPTPPPTDESCPLTYGFNCTNSFPADPCAFSDFFGGCPRGYERSGNCCKVKPCPSPRPSPPACDGAQVWLDEPICDWYCITQPGDPSQEPTPGGCTQAQADDCIASMGRWIEEECRCDHSIGPHTPVLVDISGDGFKLTGANNPVSFDLDGDSTKERLSWTAAGSDDAFLALDRDGNGRIDSGRELFGDVTAQLASPERNGFLALAEFDKAENGGNRDGVISPGDAVFVSLRLWRDANHNGVSELGELYTLPSLGVEAVSLDYRQSARRDRYGNLFRYRAKAYGPNRRDLGRWAYDVFLVRAP